MHMGFFGAKKSPTIYPSGLWEHNNVLTWFSGNISKNFSVTSDLLASGYGIYKRASVPASNINGVDVNYYPGDYSHATLVDSSDGMGLFNLPKLNNVFIDETGTKLSVYKNGLVSNNNTTITKQFNITKNINPSATFTVTEDVGIGAGVIVSKNMLTCIGDITLSYNTDSATSYQSYIKVRDTINDGWGRWANYNLGYDFKIKGNSAGVAISGDGKRIFYAWEKSDGNNQYSRIITAIEWGKISIRGIPVVRWSSKDFVDGSYTGPSGSRWGEYITCNYNGSVIAVASPGGKTQLNIPGGVTHILRGNISFFNYNGAQIAYSTRRSLSNVPFSTFMPNSADHFSRLNQVYMGDGAISMDNSGTLIAVGIPDTLASIDRPNTKTGGVLLFKMDFANPSANKSWFISMPDYGQTKVSTVPGDPYFQEVSKGFGRDVALSGDGKKLFITHDGDGSVYVYNCENL